MIIDQNVRATLISLISEIRDAIDKDGDIDELIKRFQESVPSSDIANLCESDYDDETILEIALGEKSIEKVLTQEELLVFVKKLQSTKPGSFDRESDAVKAVRLFDYNCRHPGGSDLIFYAEDHFDGRSYPTPEEIVEKALKGI